MTDWASLRQAYGGALDVPRLLAAAERSGSEAASAWSELWTCLCHQGTVYTASYAALPYLADMAESVTHDMPVYLAAAIVASVDGPADPAVIRREHVDSISRLRESALRRLSSPGDQSHFVYGLQALMAFEDGGVWQRNLDYIVEGEVPLECPSCGATLILDLGGPEYVLASSEDSTAARTPVQRVEHVEGAVAERLLTLSLDAGHTELATTLRYVLGSGTCPHCATQFNLAHGLT